MTGLSNEALVALAVATAINVATYGRIVVCGAVAHYGAEPTPIFNHMQLALRSLTMQGFFYFKEHVVSIGLTLLPAYWYFWKNAQNAEYDTARKMTTIVLAVTCWFAFLVGHVLNNTRGFGS